MPLFEIVRRVVRGVTATLIAVCTVAVWGGAVSEPLSKYLLLGGSALVLLLMLLDPAGLRSTRRRGLGILMFPRMSILLFAAAVALQGGMARWWILISVLLGALALLAEAIIFRLIKAPSIWSANIPQQPGVPRHTKGYVAVVPLSMLAVPMAIQTGNAMFPWWAVAVVIWAVFVSAVTARLVLRRVAMRRAEKQLYEAVRAFDAEQIVFTSQVEGATHQVAMWLPYLERTDKRLLIMSTSETAARAIAQVTDVPVVVRRTVASFERMAGPSLGAIFYVNANSANNLMVRYSQYQHIHLGHGDSDKPSSYNPTHGIYDHIFSAGQAAIDRYAAHGVSIPPEKFAIVGRPQVEDIEVIDAENNPPVKTVLYAPTWRGHVEGTMFHSLHCGEKIVSELLHRGMQVIFRPHPFSYNFAEDRGYIEKIQRMLATSQKRTGVDHIWGEEAEKIFTVVDCINNSDAMISDVSSVVSDFLFSGKPFAMMAISTSVDAFADEYPIGRGAYLVGEALNELPAALDDMLGQDSLQETRLEVRSYYLGNFDAHTYSQNFVNAAKAQIIRGQSGATQIAQGDSLNLTVDQGHDANETKTALEVLQYRTRVLRKLTGVKRLRKAQRFTSWGILIWTLSLFSSSVWVPILGTAVVAATGVAYWRGVLKRPGRMRKRIGEPPVFFLLLTISAVQYVDSGVLWCYLVFTAAFAINYETRALQGIRGVVATKLPGLRVDSSRAPAASALAAIVVWILLTAGLALPSLTGETEVQAILAFGVTVGFAISIWAFLCALIQAFATRKDALELDSLVTAFEPEFAVYFASNSGAKYQYGMWEPYFQRLKRPFVVIVRNRRSARIIGEITDAPVIFRPTMRGLDDVIPATMRTIFYVNNGVKNTHMVERPGLKNIWLNHGDSEKPACYNPVHAMYDLIFAAGEAGIDRYARHGVHIPREKFVITGRPQVEDIVRANDYSRADQATTILYAPTWIGPYKDADVYSLPVAEKLITQLLKHDARIIFRAHPHNYRFAKAKQYIAAVQELLKEDTIATGRQHVWGAEAEEVMSVEDCFNASDVMISDISAVISDYLQSEKPFAIMAMNQSAEEIEALIPAAKGAYVIAGDLKNLDQRLEELLVTDPLQGDRTHLRAYYLGDFPSKNYACGFLEAARTVIDRDAITA